MITRTIAGACHCRNISYELSWPDGESPITRRECGCTFCRKHGASYTSHPQSELTVDVRDMGGVTRYRFGHETAEFILCSHCGGMMFALSEIDENTYAVINVNHFENVDENELISTQTNFDDETVAMRLERRKKNWTPTVRFS